MATGKGACSGGDEGGGDRTSSTCAATSMVSTSTCRAAEADAGSIPFSVVVMALRSALSSVTTTAVATTEPASACARTRSVPTPMSRAKRVRKLDASKSSRRILRVRVVVMVTRMNGADGGLGGNGSGGSGGGEDGGGGGSALGGSKCGCELGAVRNGRGSRGGGGL
eukprot:scaffold257526_cov28-Tisochrysis_lutea.AAC.3